jgi:hypothetical protein
LLGLARIRPHLSIKACAFKPAHMHVPPEAPTFAPRVPQFYPWEHVCLCLQGPNTLARSPLNLLMMRSIWAAAVHFCANPVFL